ncbi:Hypothetical predicted protein [Mytilus galloprovincialis]|uniref:WSC domain-containing protein n=1 Tax=Mytilus galloprovincialis TaxID=29158 RepID=A0A8B6DQF1_MYTGA|nr:Hypothetical predicted protein [Mytilus galloprovincialis]
MMVIGSLFFLHFITIQVRFGASLSLFGCYWNDDGTTLPDKQLTATSTVDCIHICLTVNPSYIYAGTQKDPESCYCGLTLHSQAVTRVYSDDKCSAPCPVVVMDICGGYYRLAVYEISGLKVPVTLGGNDITTEFTKEFTTTHKKVAFTTSEVLLEQTNGSTRSTNRKSTYSLEHSTSSNKQDKTTHPKTSFNIKEGSTDFNSTHTTSSNLDHTTHPKTSFNIKEGSTDFNSTQTTSSNLDHTTHPKTTFSIQESTDFNSTHTKDFQTTQNTKQETTTPFTVNNNCTHRACICGKWSHLNGLNLSRYELILILKSELDAIRQNLIIDAKTTSAFRNKKISAPDYRKSSAVMGYSGVALICVPILFVLIIDAMRFCKK